MKTLKSFLLLSFLTLSANCLAQKTDLDSLPQQEREEYLVEISVKEINSALKLIHSKTVVNKDDFHIVIKRHQIPEGVVNEERGFRPGRISYRVAFIEDKDNPQKFIYEVRVWENTGKIFEYTFGKSGIKYMNTQNK